MRDGLAGAALQSAHADGEGQLGEAGDERIDTDQLDQAQEARPRVEGERRA